MAYGDNYVCVCVCLCRDILWKSHERPDELRFDFTSVSVSAIAAYEPIGEIRVEEGKCLYLQIDDGDDDDDDIHDDDDDDDVVEDGQRSDRVIREVHIVFDQKEQLDQAFQAMCDGALRNPDSDTDDEDPGGEGRGFFFDADSMIMGDAFDRSVDLNEWYVFL